MKFPFKSSLGNILTLCNILVVAAVRGTGQLVIEMSEAGGVALDVSDWSGPALQVNRIPDSQITLISTRNRDILLIYSIDHNKNMVIFKEQQVKYICDTEATMDAFLCFSTHDGVFYATDSTHCIQQPISDMDNQMMRVAVHLVSNL